MGDTTQKTGEDATMSPEKIRELIDKGSDDADIENIIFGCTPVPRA